MAYPKKLVVEQWIGACERTLLAMGYNSFEEARWDNFSLVRPMYRYAGNSENAANGFAVEAAIASRFSLGGMQVYDFDKDFTDSIINESWAELLPSVLEYAPHDSFYLRIPSSELFEGVVVSIISGKELDIANIDDFFEEEYVSTDAGRVVLLGSHSLSDGKWFMARCYIGDKSYWIMRYAIPSKIDYMFDETPLGEYPIELMLNALAYLCSVNADINKDYEPPAIKANPKKDKKRSKATWYSVGAHIGARLREYARISYECGTHTGAQVRPHIRRAHWHHYWVGPKDSRRIELRWLEPIEVGMGDMDMRATIHKV